MVRKWSYLKTFSLTTPNVLAPIKAVKSFKVFRKTTRFKKYNRGITKIVRRKYMTRKRKSTALFAYYITKDWVYHYLKLRQFERFYQSFGLSNVSAYAADFDVFNVAPDRINENGIHIFSVTKSIFSHFQSKSKCTQSTLRKSKVSNSKQTFIQTDSLETLSNSSFSYPIAASIENHEYHAITQTTTREKNSQLLKSVQLVQFKSTLKFLQSYNRILILLSLRNKFTMNN
jgi:hypothetical protein